MRAQQSLTYRLRRAIESRGGIAETATLISKATGRHCSRHVVHNWLRKDGYIAPHWVLGIEEVLSIPREDLAPNLYPTTPGAGKA